MTAAWVLVAVLVAMMATELRMSRRNERALREAGAIEPPGDVYPLMRVIYPLCFALMAIEGLRAGSAPLAWFVAGVIVFAAAKALKFWAITSLGTLWSFRVLVLPGGRLVSTGPYRWIRHPNYVAIFGEFIGMALALHAPVTGVVSIALFGPLIACRVAVEERALRRLS